MARIFVVNALLSSRIVHMYSLMNVWRSLCASVLALMAAPALHAAGAEHFTALDSLEPGEWELRSRDPSDAPIRLCAADLRQLLQPRHPGASCSRLVLEDGAKRTVVTYDCVGSGRGRTSLRVETARLAQIDTQGVADGSPFALVAEARRVGVCGRQTSSR